MLSSEGFLFASPLLSIHECLASLCKAPISPNSLEKTLPEVSSASSISTSQPTLLSHFGFQGLGSSLHTSPSKSHFPTVQSRAEDPWGLASLRRSKGHPGADGGGGFPTEGMAEVHLGDGKYAG